jgi:hypothetical protein
VLESIEDVQVDPVHQYAVRAYRIQGGQRRPLERAAVDMALTRAGVSRSLRPIVGVAQTDFVTVRFNKGSGLRALATEIQRDRRPASGSVVLAVGDTAADLPMLEMAVRSFAPSNADETMRRAAAAGLMRLTVVNQPHQAGLIKAVASLLGHFVGGCSRCRPPQMSPSGSLLNRMLAAQDLGKWGKLGRLFVLAAEGLQRPE